MTADISTREGLFAVMRQLAEEREAARPLVAELLAREEIPWDEVIPEEWRTAGFVEELTKAASAMAQVDPLRSESYMHFALAVAAGMTAEYPSLVRARVLGNTWKEIGWVATYHDAYELAQRSYDTAEELLSHEPALSHDQACARLSRCGTLAFTSQFEEAVRLAKESEAEFLALGDLRRAAMAQSNIALIHHERGELTQARDIYEHLLTVFSESEDLHSLGVALNNLAGTYVLLGRAADAITIANRARATYAKLGIPAEKPEWSIARAMLAKGAFAEAELLLHRIRAAFLERHMPESAGAVGLDLVECLIAQERFVEARAMTEIVIEEFRRAGLSDRVLRAVAYLRELTSLDKARVVIRELRSVVEESDRHETPMFLRPDE